MTDLVEFAARIRYLTLRELNNIGYGHFGGSLSVVEALAALYGSQLKYDPKNPKWEGRDYFVLSKGHAGPALYATLAAVGFFPEDRLLTLNANGTKLPSHPDRIKIEGVEMTTGSMGQGISAAAGIAYGLRATGRENRVYTLLGDGELNEGQCWEAVQFIAARNLTNLVVLVDDNKRQLDGATEEIGGHTDFVKAFAAFGFEALRIDGHDANAIDSALQQARMAAKPVCLVLDTVKGSGVAYVAEAADNHHMRLDDAGKAAVGEAIEELEAMLAGKGAGK